MPRTFTCCHCGKIVPRNPRIKKQKYCSLRACQNARRCTTNKVRSIKISESRLLHKARNKRWRDQHLSHVYQKRYRDAHPEYVKRNVELQLKRNKKRQKEHVPMIAKSLAALKYMTL